MAHTIVKPQKLVAAAVGVLESELVVPNTFLKKGIDDFKGAENDTINMVVPGVLPARDYAWRNDRSADLVYDEYTERKIAVTFGGNKYSAVKITDEQRDFDLKSDGFLPGIQAKAVGQGLEQAAVAKLVGETYNVTIGNTQNDFKGAFIEARRVLNAFKVPKESRVMLVGSDYGAALLDDDKMGLAQNVGQDEAVSMLKEARIGRRYGFTIVESPDLTPDTAIAYVPSAFVFLSGAPSIPASISAAATMSYEGIALRWLRQYNAAKLQEQSVVNTFYGFNTVKDPLAYWDATLNGGLGSMVVTPSEYLVRAIKLKLDGSSDYPEVGTDIAKATGIVDTKTWTPTGFIGNDDPAGANA